MVNKISNNENFDTTEKLQIIARFFDFLPPLSPPVATPRQTAIEKWFKFGLTKMKPARLLTAQKLWRKEAGCFLARKLRAPREVTLRSQPSLLRALGLLRDSRRPPASLELMMSPR